MASDPEDGRADRGPQRISDGAGPRVLLLDDERELAHLVAFVLERSGFCVHAAGDGNGASRLLQELDFAVALVDLLLPGMSGAEFLRETSLLAPRRRPSVVVMSALSREIAEREIDGLPYFALLTKPFDLAALPDLVARAAAARPGAPG